ncbi:hypothetical protein A2U01_0046200, partial [Trifolium medium]|nr:hypothetical protein [Trifolium medium]
MGLWNCSIRGDHRFKVNGQRCKNKEKVRKKSWSEKKFCCKVGVLSVARRAGGTGALRRFENNQQESFLSSARRAGRMARRARGKFQIRMHNGHLRVEQSIWRGAPA